MQEFELTEKVFSFGDGYEVRAQGKDEVLYAVSGKVVTLGPKLSMRKADGAEVATLAGDALNTSFVIRAADGRQTGSVVFPLGPKKAFAMKSGDVEYQASGDVLGRTYECKNAAGDLALRIVRSGLLQAKLAVQIHADVPVDVALLTAVAVHQKYS